MGLIDKVLRILVAIVIVALFFAKVISGVLAIVLLIFAGVFILTSLIGFCPLYKPMGMDTTKKDQ